MKTPNPLPTTLRALPRLGLALAGLALAGSAWGATQYATGSFIWDNGTTTAWGTATGGPYTSLWTAGNDAVLEGTAGTITLSGPTVENITFNTTGFTLSGASTLTLSGTTPTLFLGSGVSATIGNNTAAVLGGSVGLTKSGVGTLTLNGNAVHTFTGGLTLNGGTLTEDFTNLGTPTDLVNNGNALTLGGGTLTLKGKASSVLTSQTFASTTVNSGGGVVTLTQNGATNVTAVLGAITRNPGGTLNFSVVPGTTNNLTTTTGNEASGILGRWASVGTGTTLQYAANNGSGTIISYAGATTTTQPANLSDVNNAGVNYAYGATPSPTLTGPITANTLRFTGATGGLTNAGNNITLNGLMSAGSGALTITGTGNLVIGGSQELDIFVNSQGATLNTRIVDNGAGASSLVYGGPGTLSLNTSSNSYSGGTVINYGTLTTFATGNSTDTYLGTGPVTVNAGGTLALNRTYLANSLTLNNGTLVSGNGFPSTLPAGSTITLNGISTFNVSGNLTIAANMTGPGGLTKTSATVALPVIGYNNYTGPTTISQGDLEFMPQALYGTDSSYWTPANISVASGAGLGLFFSDSGSLNGSADFTSAQLDTLLGNLTAGLYNNGLRAGSFIGLDTSHGNGTYASNITDSTGTGGGAVGLQKIGANALTLSGNNTFSGPVMIGPYAASGGTLKVYSLNYITSGTLSPNTSSSLGHPTTTANGVITCGNPSNNQGVGLTYLGTGETTDRILNLAAGVSGGGTALTLDQSGTGLLKFTSPITVATTASRTLVLQGSTSGTGELAGAITNASTTGYISITKNGTGTWTLSGANTYQPVSGSGGLTTINGGCLVLGSANALPGGIGVSGGLSPLTFNGGVLGLGFTNFTRSLAAAGTANAANFTGNGGWAAYGTNRTVNLGGASATITWATAGTGFNGKTLILGNATATHTLDFQNPIDLGTANRTVQVDDGAAVIDAKLSGNITGSTGGNLTKTGNGTLALTGLNNYTGTTTVSAGCLLINGTNSGLGLITVNSGATNGGTGTVAGPATYSSGAYAVFTVTPDPISSTTNLTPLTIAGAMTYNGNQVVLNAPTNLPSGTYILAVSSTAATANAPFPTPILLTGSYAPGVTDASVSLDAGGTNLILTVTGLSANPTRLAIISVNGGTSPTAQVGFPVVVQSQDDNGAPRVVLSDTAVQLSKKAGNYLLSGTLTGTIPAGSSSVTISGVTYAAADTNVVLTATRTSGDSLTSGDSAPFNVLASTAPSYLTVTGFPTPQTAGVAGSVTVTCKTLSGSTATSYSGTVHFSSTATSAGLPADYTFVPATDNGVHTFTGVTLNTAGTQTLTATDTGTPSLTGSQNNIVIKPAAASALAVSEFPTPQATNVAGSVTVAAQDAFANTVTNYTGTIHFTSSDSLAVLPANYTFVTGDAGLHLFTNGVTFKTLGSNQWLAATDTGTPSLTGTQANITIWIFPTQFAWTNSAGGNWSAGANWTNDKAVVFAPLAAGESDYSLSFGAGTYTATDDLNDGFRLNQLNFAGAATLASPSGSPRSLTFTNNGSVLPQINQNGNGSTGTVLVLNPINLATNVTIGGAGSGGLSLYGVISGLGGLITTNPNNTVTIGIANTYSGGTLVNAGTLSCAIVLSNPLGSGLATLSSGASFNLNASTCANPFALYGGTLVNGNGFTANMNGPVYLGANSTVDLSTSGNMKIAGNMSGPGGLIKLGTGSGPLILAGTNTYTGTNFINAGSIRFDITNAVAPGGLSITAPAKANLNYGYGNTAVISALILDGVAQTNGTYGSSSSTATTVDDVHFSGTGTVTVSAGLPPLTTPPVLAPGTGFSVSSGTPSFTFSTIAGYKYRLVYTADVTVPTASWQPVVNNPPTDSQGWVVATGSSLTLTDPTPIAGVPKRFYRIEGSAP